MQRRSALKNVALTLGGLVTLPAWAMNWTPESIGHAEGLVASEEALLAEIVETIIPETTTPGAKSLKVHQYALRMINDCYGEKAQETLKKGIAIADQTATQLYQKNFDGCDSKQRLIVLNALSSSSEADAKQFVSLIKNLTIQGYMNSEYVQVNFRDYNMAPGFYHGCVPLKK